MNRLIKTLVPIIGMMQLIAITFVIAGSGSETICSRGNEALLDRYDMFPLANNHRLRYSYYYYHHEVQRYSASYQDSILGTVEYLILFSEVHDTLTIWTIEEHQLLDKFHQDIPPHGTVHTTIDNHATLYLYESMNGNHPIRASSAVFESPMYNPNVNDSIFFSRYASTETVRLPVERGGIYDTLDFIAETGLVKRHQTTFRPGMFGTIWGELSATLQSDSTLGVMPPFSSEPLSVKLRPNYPNPFNPTTSISYALPSAGNVRITVYDVLGREMSLLVNESQTAGEHQVVWNAEGQPSGVYYYRLEMAGTDATKDRVSKIGKMVLLR